ncbi:MAG: hypothetical protein KDB99_06385, partial [Chitinophagaceae bacterium]|nr:hypothetical protein [Chitinophagaceae bacterium]
MKGSIQLPVVLLMLFACLTTIGQKPEITPVPFPYKEFPTLIIGMAQDARGYIWLADNSQGLFRYDGIKLTSYRSEPGNPNSLVSDVLECVAASPDGTIWIGSFSNGLSQFNPITETFITFKHDDADPQSLRSDFIRAIVCDSAGGAWIGTAKGIDYFDPATRTFKHQFTNDGDEKYLQEDHVRSLYMDREGVLWAGCGSTFNADGKTTGGLFKIDIKQQSVKRFLHSSSENSLMDNRVKAILEDSKGNFWVGTAGDGLHTMDRNTGTFTRHRYDPANLKKLSRPPLGDMYDYTSDFITSLLEDNQGRIWIITTQGGINCFDPEKNIVQHYGTNEAGAFYIFRNDFWSGLKTKDGQLWLSGWTNRQPDDQLLKINTDSRKFTKQSLNKAIYAFAEDKEKNIYMAASRSVIRMNASGSYDTILKLNQYIPIDKTRITDVETGTGNNLWISSGAGLFQYNLATKDLRVFTPAQKRGLESYQINSTYELNKDSILVGTQTGLYLLDLPANRFLKLGTNDDKIGVNKELIVRDIFRDAHQNIWIIAPVVVLMRLDIRTMKFYKYSWGNVPADNVYSMVDDPATGLYIGTWRSGLRHYNTSTDQFESVTDNSGMLKSQTQVFSVTAGKNKDLWLEVDEGIIHFHPETGTSSIYGGSWGFDIHQITHYGFFRSSAGDYYKGTQYGYLSFRPSDFENEGKIKIEPFIGKLLVNNKVMEAFSAGYKKLNLGFQENNIAFELGYINFLSDPADQYLQYNLEGYDEGWRSGENGELVNYYKVSPGKYNFRLKGMDMYGKWTEINLPVVISPPWYKTWWAYTLIALLIISVLRIFIVYRNKKLIAENKVLERKVRERTTELEQSLETLRSTQSQLIQSEKMASLGELTAGIAHEIQNPLNFVN